MGRPRTLPESIDKTCPVCEKIFTIAYVLRNRRRYCSKRCANHDPKVIEKMITSQTETYNKKYGMHPMKTELTKSNLRVAVMKKYGVDWISKSDGWYDKVKATKVQLHGIDNYNNTKQREETCIERYGVNNPTKHKGIRESIIKTVRDKHYDYLVNYCNNKEIGVLFKKSDYKGYRYFNKYKFECNKCKYVFEESINNSLGAIFCEKCDPDQKKTLENEFFNFLVSLLPTPLIKRHDRTILYGKELDFYLPELKIAFELNGLYWHSEMGHGISKNYHLNKTKGCLAHGIKLVHIFENEWRDSKELVKSIIRDILKIVPATTIDSNDCDTREVSNFDKGIFLNENHIRGIDKSTVKVGLYYKDELVSLMTFRRSGKFNSNIGWEMSRYSNKRDYAIINSDQVLFSYFIKKYNPLSIIGYTDRRYFSEDFYLTLGFKFIGNTMPSYYYISPDYKNLFRWTDFQKHLLSKRLLKVDNNLTTWENMRLNGYDRIWDCGYSKWVWTIH